MPVERAWQWLGHSASEREVLGGITSAEEIGKSLVLAQLVVALVLDVVHEEIEGLRIGRDTPIHRLFGRHSHQQAPHRDLHPFARARGRNGRHLEYLVGYM